MFSIAALTSHENTLLSQYFFTQHYLMYIMPHGLFIFFCVLIGTSYSHIQCLHTRGYVGLHFSAFWRAYWSRWLLQQIIHAPFMSKLVCFLYRFLFNFCSKASNLKLCCCVQVLLGLFNLLCSLVTSLQLRCCLGDYEAVVVKYCQPPDKEKYFSILLSVLVVCFFFVVILRPRKFLLSLMEDYIESLVNALMCCRFTINVKWY